MEVESRAIRTTAVGDGPPRGSRSRATTAAAAAAPRAADLTWIEPHLDAGNALLDENRSRVDEILELSPDGKDSRLTEIVWLR